MLSPSRRLVSVAQPHETQQFLFNIPSVIADESVKRKVVDDEVSEVPEKRAKTDDVEAVEAAEEEVATA